MSVQQLPPGTPISFDPVQEVRLAVVIYGGLSLAIYINGIVQEMLRFVRATAPLRGPDSDQPLLEESQLVSSERVYRRLGQILNDPDHPAAHLLEAIDNGAHQPIRTRFVIDILSGTSAGGINAIFLAKALANNQSLAELQKLWLSQGDVQELINDQQSLKPRLTRQNPPQSLLNSNRMYLELLSALDGMDAHSRATGRPSSPSPLVEELDLFSTTTDIRGLTVPLNLTDGVVYERQHKNVFHFKYPADDAQARTDFGQDSNPFLAFAARCTSAFPFAFEPMELADIFPIVSTAELHVGAPYCDPATGYWERFYDHYVRADYSSPRSQPFHFRAFGDGGYLDNKPFSYAIDTTLTRHSAELPIERKLVYIEPNPQELGAQPTGAARPNAIENSLAALLVLPRYETIRADLERVINRNLEIERVNRVIADVKGLLSAPTWNAQPDAWINSAPDAYGSGYATYERLKVSAVTDELANILSLAYGIDPNGAFGKAVRTLASVWRDLEYPHTPDQRRFLFDFDVAYRLRRVRYIRRRIQEEYAEPQYPQNLVALYRKALRDAKSPLGVPHSALQGLLRRPVFVPNAVPQAVFTSDQMSLVAQPPADLAMWPGLTEYTHVEERSERGARQRATYVLEVCKRRQVVTELAKTVAERFRPVLIQASNAIRASFGEEASAPPPTRDARAFVRREYDSFDLYDSASFAITFGTDVDVYGPVGIHRISPDDATAREDVLQGYPKLRGQAVASFGAFLDYIWRRNDILWGRLDGAERLIAMALPGADRQSAELRRQLVDRTHEEIVCEFFEIESTQRHRWKQTLKEFVATVPGQPAPELIARSAARCTAVTGDLLEGISDGYAARAKPLFTRMAFFGRMFWNFIEVSVPHTLGDLFGNYWMQLLSLFAVMLFILAIFTSNPSEMRLAATVAAAVLVLFTLRQLLRRFLRGAVVLAPAAVSILTILATVGLTSLIIYLMNAPILRQVTGSANAGSTLPTALQVADLRDPRWGWVFLACSLFVTVVSGIWRLNAVHRVRCLGQHLNVIGKLKFSRRWRDVTDALGLSNQTQQTNADATTHDDQSTVRSAARAAIIRASSLRAAVIRALGADHVFTTAYALAFIAIVRCMAPTGWSFGHGWVFDTTLFGVLGLGIGAAAANMAANRRILRVLEETPPQDREQLLAAPPRPYSIAKWLTITMAGAVVIVLLSEVLTAMRHTLR
jgi:patatin-related protein